MTTAMKHPEPFGLATVSDNLPEAMRFYTAMYPYEIKEEVFAGINARKFQSDGNSNSATSLAPVGANPCGVSQITLPTTTIRKPILMTVREETVIGIKRPRMAGANNIGKRNISDLGSGAG